MSDLKKYPKKVSDFLDKSPSTNEELAVNFILQGMSERRIVSSWESVVLLLNNLEKSYLKELPLTEIKKILESCKELYNE